MELQTSVSFERRGERKVHAQLNVAKPLNGFITIPDGPKHDLSVQVVRQLLDKLGSGTLQLDFVFQLASKP